MSWSLPAAPRDTLTAVPTEDASDASGGISGGGTRTPPAELYRRLGIIEELYIRYGDGLSTIRACRLIPGPVPNTRIELPLSTRRRYVRAIERMWAIQDKSERESKRPDFVRFVRSVIRRAEAKGQHQAVLRGLELYAKVIGLYAPEPAGSSSAPPAESFEGWTVEEMDAYQAMKARARGEATVLKLVVGGGSNGKANGTNGKANGGAR